MTDRELLEDAAKAAGLKPPMPMWVSDNKDPLAATRRAIVRAAAEIGRSMT